MGPDGTNHRQITSGSGDKTDASFSPDGNWIVYSSDEGGLDFANLFIISVAGGSSKRLTNFNGYDGVSSWAPDGFPGTTLWILDLPIDNVTPQNHSLPPTEFDLKQNYPNPFNPETVIEYQLPRASVIEIYIFNSRGQKIATLTKSYQNAGFHKIFWDGRDDNGIPVASAIYLYQLKACDFSEEKKMLLLR